MITQTNRKKNMLANEVSCATLEQVSAKTISHRAQKCVTASGESFYMRCFNVYHRWRLISININ